MPFIHEHATVLGDVILGDRVSIWPMAVVRGDSARITIGADSNVQDGAVLHADEGTPCIIGTRVTIGHRAIVHGAKVGDGCLIGMGAIVLNHAEIGEGSLVGAGAVVPESMVVPPGSVVLGIPGKVVKQVDEATRARIEKGVDAYIELARRHQHGEFPQQT